jgi:hypothetical protein
MPRSSRITPRARAQAIGLTLLAHAVVLALVGMERRAPRRAPTTPEPQYVSIWLEPQNNPQPKPGAVKRGRPAPRNASPPAASRVSQPQETSIAPEATKQVPQKDLAQPGARTAQSAVDWNAAAAEAAARAAKDAGQKSFSAAPLALREPCKPRQFDAQTKGLMAERLPEPPDPDSVGPDPTANCIMVGGFPKCVQKISRPRRNSGLKGDPLSDRLAGKRHASSVPSPDVCD